MLQKLRFQPGFNKQVTATGGEGQWVSGDYVRFRYGSPEKIGGWAQLGDNTLTGRNTALHHFVNASGTKYAALGTNRFLYVYSGGVFYDITPLKSTNTLTSAFTTTQSDATVTITFASPHNISKYDIIRLDSFTAITNSNFAASDFNDTNFIKIREINELKGMKVICVAGVASPESFFNLVDSLEATILKRYSYPDHYFFNESDVKGLIKEAEERGAFLLTTEKDVVKLRKMTEYSKLMFLGIEVCFRTGEEDLKDKISQVIAVQ